jgi:hypothetical protein
MVSTTLAMNDLSVDKNRRGAASLRYAKKGSQNKKF